MFRSVGSLIGRTTFKTKSSDSIIALQVRQIATEALKRLLKKYPEEVEKQLKVKSYKNGVLLIAAPNVIAAELYLKSADLMDSINGKVGKKILRSIKFRAP